MNKEVIIEHAGFYLCYHNRLFVVTICTLPPKQPLVILVAIATGPYIYVLYLFYLLRALVWANNEIVVERIFIATSVS